MGSQLQLFQLETKIRLRKNNVCLKSTMVRSTQRDIDNIKRRLNNENMTDQQRSELRRRLSELQQTLQEEQAMLIIQQGCSDLKKTADVQKFLRVTWKQQFKNFEVKNN